MRCFKGLCHKMSFFQRSKIKSIWALLVFQKFFGLFFVEKINSFSAWLLRKRLQILKNPFHKACCGSFFKQGSQFSKFKTICEWAESTSLIFQASSNKADTSIVEREIKMSLLKPLQSVTVGQRWGGVWIYIKIFQSDWWVGGGGDMTIKKSASSKTAPNRKRQKHRNAQLNWPLAISNHPPPPFHPAPPGPTQAPPPFSLSMNPSF